MVVAGGVLTLALLPPVASGAQEIGPGADLCAEINSLDPGQELVLVPGEYQGPFAIRRGGEPGAPLVIRGAGPARSSSIVYDGRKTNVLEVRASHVVIRGLEFGPTQSSVDAAHVPAGRPAVPAPQPGLQLAGNVDCTWVPCFANPDGIDFSPFPGSVLTSPGALRMRGSMPREDFFGVRRGVPPTVGAIERPAGPISLQPQP